MFLIPLIALVTFTLEAVAPVYVLPLDTDTSSFKKLHYTALLRH